MSSGQTLTDVQWQPGEWHHIHADYEFAAGNLHIKIEIPTIGTYITTVPGWTEDGNDGVFDYDIRRLGFASNYNHSGLIDSLEWGATNDTWTPEPATAGLILHGYGDDVRASASRLKLMR